MPIPTFTPEPLRATANEVFFSSDGTRIARVHFNDDTITEEEARAYAAQFAASTQMKLALIAALELINLQGPGEIPMSEEIDHEKIIAEAEEALAACEPLPKGRPFARPYNPQKNPCQSKPSGPKNA